ncbi:hypothetical protein [Carnobacterium antarcticum]|uniref:Transposase n=1 Tax=Carnobacterium antarcticum TaxID=2126436 RepID=A0ABW4NMM7_9LACT|nr:hypothetical protein [Carnobacterium sp. CP1]ALV20739.1 hypothetical protein NY10_114 [Carnobacterium sp. CP1]
MNKRIKKKVTKRAINKYDNKEKLTVKEIKLIKSYITLKSFDYLSLWKGVKSFFTSFFNKLAQVFKRASKQALNLAKALNSPNTTTVKFY